MRACELFGLDELLPMRRDHCSPWLGPATPRALERGALRQQTPESVLITGCSFDDVLREIVRDHASAEGHDTAGDADAFAADRLPVGHPRLVVAEKVNSHDCQ